MQSIAIALAPEKELKNCAHETESEGGIKVFEARKWGQRGKVSVAKNEEIF